MSLKLKETEEMDTVRDESPRYYTDNTDSYSLYGDLSKEEQDLISKIESNSYNGVNETFAEHHSRINNRQQVIFLVVALVCVAVILVVYIISQSNFKGKYRMTGVEKQGVLIPIDELDEAIGMRVRMELEFNGTTVNVIIDKDYVPAKANYGVEWEGNNFTIGTSPRMKGYYDKDEDKIIVVLEDVRIFFEKIK